MKVTLDLRNVKVTSVEKNDKDQVLSITIEPVFAAASGQALVLTGETATSRGRKIEEFKLNVSGKTGKTSLDATTPGVTVAPKIDADETPAASRPNNPPKR